MIPAVIFAAYALALHRWSGRHGWFGPVMIVLVGLGFPFYIEPIGLASDRIVQETLNPQGAFGGLAEAIALAVFLCGVITGAGLYAATMSRLILVVTLGASAITGGTCLIDVNLPRWAIVIVYAIWHGPVIASMWWWAKGERIRRRADSGACAKCGYDLTGLRSPVCPECGHTIRAGSASARSDAE